MKGLIGCLKFIASYIVVLLVLAFVAALVGCKSRTVYVPVESVKKEYIHTSVRDSVFLLDSVFVDRWKSNDTVFSTKEKYKYLYRDKVVRDTVLQTDSIYVPYPVPETKEVNKLHTWQIVLMCLGGVLIGFLGYKIYRLF